MPGINTRGVRLQVNQHAQPRQWLPGSSPGSTLDHYLRQIAWPVLEPRLPMVFVTSWNEWNEDTAVQPVGGVPTDRDDSASGTGYTQGYTYGGEGAADLRVIRDSADAAWGRVVDAAGRPMVHTRVVETEGGAPVDAVRTDSQGWYVLPRPRALSGDAYGGGGRGHPDLRLLRRTGPSREPEGLTGGTLPGGCGNGVGIAGDGRPVGPGTRRSLAPGPALARRGGRDRRGDGGAGRRGPARLPLHAAPVGGLVLRRGQRGGDRRRLPVPRHRADLCGHRGDAGRVVRAGAYVAAGPVDRTGRARGGGGGVGGAGPVHAAAVQPRRLQLCGPGGVGRQGHQPLSAHRRAPSAAARYLDLVDPLWRHAPAPYGPAWERLSGWIVERSGHTSLATVVGFRWSPWSEWR